jgi:hypothetical protein
MEGHFEHALPISEEPRYLCARRLAAMVLFANLLDEQQRGFPFGSSNNPVPFGR